MRTSENGKGAVDEKSMAPLFYGLAKKTDQPAGQSARLAVRKGFAIKEAAGGLPFATFVFHHEKPYWSAIRR